MEIHHSKAHGLYIKCAFMGRGRILAAARAHIDYLFPIGNENVFSSQNCIHFILPSEFWSSFHNDKNRPVLNIYENEIIRISLYTSSFLLKKAQPLLQEQRYYNNKWAKSKNAQNWYNLKAVILDSFTLLHFDKLVCNY